MNWQTFSDHLAAQHGTDYQAIYKITHALRAIHESLDLLAGLGHPFHLEDGPPPSQQEWPKVMFHESCHQGQLVHSQQDIDDLGDGWRPSLAEARYAHGLRQQFKGRGGVKLRDVPALLMGQKVEGATLTREERIKAAKDALEEYWATIGLADEPQADTPEPHAYTPNMEESDAQHLSRAETNDAGC